VDAQGRFSYTPAADWNGVDTFTLQVGDGRHTALLPFTVQVQAVDDAPALALGGLSAPPGGTVTFTPAQLAITDVDTPQNQLRYEVAAVSGASFEYLAAPGVPISGFTQDQVAQGQIVLRLHGTAAPSFTLRAMDGSSATPWIQGDVTLVGVPAAAVQPPAGAAFQPALPEADAVQANQATPVAGPADAVDVQASGAATPPAALTPLERARAAAADLRLAEASAPSEANFDAAAAPESRRTASIESRAGVSARLRGVQAVALGWPGSVSTVLPDFQSWFESLAGLTLAQGSSGIAQGPGVHGGPESEGPAQFQAELGSLELGGLAAAVLLVSWAVRAGGIVGSLAITSPAWRMIDPLPIIGDRADDDDLGPDPQDEALAAEVLVGGFAR
jgi:hypothetical protein